MHQHRWRLFRQRHHWPADAANYSQRSERRESSLAGAGSYILLQNTDLTTRSGTTSGYSIGITPPVGKLFFRLKHE
jgi:hypothetical protein